MTTIKQTEELQIPKELNYQIIAMQTLASRLKFKDAIPSMPKKITENTLRGFKGRFHNWKEKLMHINRMNELNLNASSHSEKALKSAIILNK